MQKQKFFLWALALTFLPLAQIPAVAESHALESVPIQRKCEFRSNMRKLWEDHVTWTRLYIISEFANLPDKESTANRLLQNQKDIGAAIAPFYGPNGGAQLTKLLTVHIEIAAKLLAAAESRDPDGVKKANEEWQANGNEIALFLAKANPRNWSETHMKIMMKSHLDLTAAEALAYLEGRYAESATLYDRVHLQALTMADMLSSGIIQQFPRFFR
ncbi:MAG TPA: hypothetical protein VIH99_11380 [Bdellovibrionota bacterium]|jgi:hypothetical protein